jgi:two-component system, chemotaxis family, protein-glutamate methylesterase/glutaminase
LPNRDILVIGASAGGVQALSLVVEALPADLKAAVFVVTHLAPHGSSAMPAILTRAGRLPAVHPRDGERIEGGRIYVAPPDQHLVIEDGRVRLSRGPTENGHRPAVDVLFRTASHNHGSRVVGVVLTGNLDDGTAGLAAIKSRGGIAVVQDPAEADYPGMPRSAIENVEVDHVLPLGEIGPLLGRLALQLAPDPNGPDKEAADMKAKIEKGADREKGGEPSGYTCPECGGALWESHENELVHFRCRTGHAFAPESLLAEQFEGLEWTLWAAVRALEENASLARRMERWMRQRGNQAGENRYDKRAREAEKHAAVLRKVLMEDQTSLAEDQA